MDDMKRGFVRVTADCPILYRVVGSDDDRELKSDRFDPISSIETHDIASKIHAGGEHRDDLILELLLWIDWKVNYLIKARSYDKERERFPYEAVMVDLSASGMRFYSDKQEPAGSKLQFRFILPILPFKEMTIDGDVIHSRLKGNDQDSSPQFEIGLEFSDIKESDRESLFSYVIKRERQIRHEQTEQDSKGIPT